jgi:hypothetical protein
MPLPPLASLEKRRLIRARHFPAVAKEDTGTIPEPSLPLNSRETATWDNESPVWFITAEPNQQAWLHN